MEKYAKLMKGLEKCAGPECCKDGCPYYGETRGGNTCRAWLLHDAAAAIANEEAGSDTLLELLHNTEAERDNVAAEVDHLEAEKNAYRTERDKLAEKCAALEKKVAHITTDRDALRALRCPPKKDTDRPSVSDDALKSEYKRGYLDAMEYCFRELCKRAGGGRCHD